jgi:2-keto-4-pentenoate hydratase/2-oxohepta-3-ene-1,7-dioic acid hydratase in catechol pathway
MRLITFEDIGRRTRVGGLAPDGRIVDLNSACAQYLRNVETEGAFQRLADALVPANMRDLFAGGDTSLETARKAFDYVLEAEETHGSDFGSIFYSAEEITPKAPIIPKKFFASVSYFRDETPAAEFSNAAISSNVFFLNVDAIIGHEEPVIYPEHLTQELDCEAKLAVVLKKSGKNFAAEDAAEYIGGYVVANEITARDIQRRESKSGISGFCKGIDTFCPLGPWIVTADEIQNPQALAIKLRVNDHLRQTSGATTTSMEIPQILAQYSAMSYSAGDVFSFGAASTAGTGDRKGRYLKAGDVVECEIESIGILRNRIISWEEAYGVKPPGLAIQQLP